MALEVLPGAALELDSGGTVLAANALALELFGCRLAEVGGLFGGGAYTDNMPIRRNFW